MFILLTLLLTCLMTWFVAEIYAGIISSGAVILLIFVGWNIIFWLLSFFYNRKAFFKTQKIFSFISFYLKELVLASLRVAYEVLSSKNHMRPAIVAIPLEVKTDLEITLLANFITLTPGTLSIDVSKDRKTLYIHVVYLASGDNEQFKEQIKNGFEQKILQITRS